MQDKLLQLLARDDVKELALQADRPPCVLIGDQYSPVLKRNFTEDEVLEVLGAANGRAEILGLMAGPRRWDYQHPEIGLIRISAGYNNGSRLQARLKREAPPRAADAPTAGAEPRVPRGTQASFPALAPVRGPEGAVNQAPEAAPARTAEPARAPEPARPAARQPVDGAPSPAAPPARPAPPVAGVPAPPAAAPAAARPVQMPPAAPVSQTPPIAAVHESSPESAALFEALLELSRTTRASDLHILADRPPMLRLAGDLVPQGDPLPAELVADMLLGVVPAGPRRDLDQHGACDFALVHPKLGRFRANVTRQRTGYKLTARPIPEEVPTLESLGLPEQISLATHHHQGLIVVTGPTGHGKTSTLAAIVDLINSEHSGHIITVEDPIEYVHPRKQAMISQRQAGLHTKSFAAALKGSLREDPDVIVVGELRDTETVRMALSAAETGHLVISTMNTPTAAKAIERLIDLFPPGDQPQVRMTLAGGLRLITSQRLVPTADRQGLCAAVELLPGTPTLWALIRDNKTFQIPSLQQRGKALGIIRLDDSLADLVRSGRTTLEIAKEFAEAPDQLENLVNPKPKPLDPNQAATPDSGAGAGKFGKDMLSKAGKLFGNERK